MLRLLVMVAVVFAFLAMPAAAQDAAPLWHCDAVTVTPVAGGYDVVATGAGAWWRIKRVGGSVVAGPQQSQAFRAVSLSEGIQYQVQAADAYGGPWSNNTECTFTPPPPLAYQIDRFEALCSLHGARLEWDMLSETGVTGYTLYKDGAQIAYVPSNCPGCNAPASYAYVHVTQAPNGLYRLQHDIGPYGISQAEATLNGCTVAPPTAVKLSRFTAR